MNVIKIANRLPKETCIW